MNLQSEFYSGDVLMFESIPFELSITRKVTLAKNGA